jgi:hypothetical protein
MLSTNPSARDLLYQHPEKIQYPTFLENPCAFEYDYEGMKQSRESIVEELMQKRFHPKYIDQFESWGF